MTVSMEDRRLCPCTHIVALAEKTSGELKLVQKDIDHIGIDLRDEIKDVLTDYREMNLSVKECLETMQKTAIEFMQGISRFERIEADISGIKLDASAYKLSAKEHSADKIRSRKEEEDSYRKGVKRSILFCEFGLGATCLFLLRTHGSEAISFISTLVLK